MSFLYPDIPYEGLSWPITQHAGVITPAVLLGLLEACSLCSGKPVDSGAINSYLISKGLLTANVRSDSQRPDAWRDYQQILSELGLIYSTKVVPNIFLTPVATAYIDGSITYDELITLQVLKYQYPNGHKTQVSKSFRESLDDKADYYTSFTQIQYENGILIRPAVAIYKILFGLIKSGEKNILSIDEMQCYVVRCLRMEDIPFCIAAIKDLRHGGCSLVPLPRARRNMADWIKILNNTPLFQMTAKADAIMLSSYSLENADAILGICDELSEPASFWLPTVGKFKLDWFAFYGNIDVSINLIPQESDTYNLALDDEMPIATAISPDSREICLHPFVPIDTDSIDATSKDIISTYDYGKTQRGRNLHNSMINMIANKCISHGASIAVDPKTVDLYIVHNNNEFLIEVKSITPKNFIARLRYAIGQIHQYDFLMPVNSANNRKLALAFTAGIPETSWSIPFITEHLNMGLITLDNGALRTYGSPILEGLVS